MAELAKDKDEPQDIEIELVELKEGEEPPETPDNDAPAGQQAVDDDAREGAETDEDARDARLGDVDERDLTKAERRKLYKIRTKARIESERQELALRRQQVEALAAKVAALENRTASSDQFLIAQKAREVMDYKARADEIVALAVTKGDAEAFKTGQRMRDEATQAEVALRNAVAQMQNAPRPAPIPTALPVPPGANRLAQGWVQEKAPWFDPQGRDPDSKIVSGIELKLMKEGEHAHDSPEFWEELTRRAAEALPDRFPQQARRVNGGRREAPTVISSESAPRNGKQTITITAGQARTMRMAGIDPSDVHSPNPQLRADARDLVRRYQEQNRADAARRR